MNTQHASQKDKKTKRADNLDIGRANKWAKKGGYAVKTAAGVTGAATVYTYGKNAWETRDSVPQLKLAPMSL